MRCYPSHFKDQELRDREANRDSTEIMDGKELQWSGQRSEWNLLSLRDCKILEWQADNYEWQGSRELELYRGGWGPWRTPAAQSERGAEVQLCPET